MDAIISNLKDPSWWFSAFFIAIVASVIAGFLKDRIEKWLSSVFSGLKSWRAAHEEARSKFIEALLADHFYFQLMLFRLGVLLVIWSLCLVTYYLAPMFLSTAPGAKDFPLQVDRQFFIWQVLTPVIGFYDTVISYRTFKSLSVVLQAIREYRKRNGLPKLL